MKNKKYGKFAAIAAALVLTTAMTACGTSKSDSYIADSYGNAAMDESAEYSQSNAEIQDLSTGDDAEYEDKIIRTATVYMESDDAQKCYDTLLKFAEENGGGELTVNKDSDSYENYSCVTITATLRISPGKLNEFIELAEKTDEVTSSSISADDVTSEYYDIKIRLESKKAALENYYDLLKKAESIQDSLEIQRYITDLTAEIESMEGKLKYYDNKTELSTIELTISESHKNISAVDDDFEWDSLSLSDVGTLIKNGFLSVVNFLWSLLLWIIIIAAALSPILLIAAAVIIIVHRRKKHSKQVKTDQKPKDAK